MLEIFRCNRKASNIEPLKAIIGNFYWGVLLDPQGNFLELTGGVEKLTGGSTPQHPQQFNHCTGHTSSLGVQHGSTHSHKWIGLYRLCEREYTHRPRLGPDFGGRVKDNCS